jgi:hypothetical protein
MQRATHWAAVMVDLEWAKLEQEQVSSSFLVSSSIALWFRLRVSENQFSTHSIKRISEYLLQVYSGQMQGKAQVTVPYVGCGVLLQTDFLSGWMGNRARTIGDWEL